jgi:hypothetical protein
MRDKPIVLLERMLHEDYDHKGSAELKNQILILKGIGGKPPVIK